MLGKVQVHDDSSGDEDSDEDPVFADPSGTNRTEQQYERQQEIVGPRDAVGTDLTPITPEVEQEDPIMVDESLFACVDMDVKE